nr:MAG TPA_asm: hypothetical protein [Caudoviricetes sp.]
MLKKLFTPGRTQAFDKQIPAGTDNAWVSFEGSNYGLPMEPGVYAVTVIPSAGVTLQNVVGVNLFADNSYDWVNFQPGVAVRLYWKSKGELRFRTTSTNGGYVTVLVTPVTNSLSLSLVESAAAWLRRWQHGAKARWFSRPDGIYPRGQWRRMGHIVRFPRAVGSRREKHQIGTRPLQGGGHRGGLCNYLQRVTVGGNGRFSYPHRVPRDPRIRLTNLRERRRHHHHHQAGLTPVGGGC